MSGIHQLASFSNMLYIKPVSYSLVNMYTMECVRRTNINSTSVQRMELLSVDQNSEKGFQFNNASSSYDRYMQRGKTIRFCFLNPLINCLFAHSSYYLHFSLLTFPEKLKVITFQCSSGDIQLNQQCLLMCSRR